MTDTTTTTPDQDWTWFTPDRAARIGECAESAARYLTARNGSTATADDIQADMLSEIHSAANPGALADDGKALGTLGRSVGQREARRASAALGILSTRGPRSDVSGPVPWEDLTETDRARVAATLTIGRISGAAERFIGGQWRPGVWAVDTAGVVTAPTGPSERDRVDAILAAHTTRNVQASARPGVTVTGRPVPAGVVTTRFRPGSNMAAAWAALTIRGVRHRDSDAGVGSHTLHAVHSAESVLIRDASEYALIMAAGPLLAECAPFIAERVVSRKGKVRNAGRVNVAALSAERFGRADAGLTERTRRTLRADGRAAERSAGDLFTFLMSPSHHAGECAESAAYCPGAENVGRVPVSGVRRPGALPVSVPRVAMSLGRVLALGRAARVADRAERAAWSALCGQSAYRNAADSRAWSAASAAKLAALAEYHAGRAEYRPAGRPDAVAVWECGRRAFLTGNGPAAWSAVASIV